VIDSSFGKIYLRQAPDLRDLFFLKSAGPNVTGTIASGLAAAINADAKTCFA
jgi:hypothetical protein